MLRLDQALNTDFADFLRASTDTSLPVAQSEQLRSGALNHVMVGVERLQRCTSDMESEQIDALTSCIMLYSAHQSPPAKFT